MTRHEHLYLANFPNSMTIEYIWEKFTYIQDDLICEARAWFRGHGETEEFRQMVAVCNSLAAVLFIPIQPVNFPWKPR